MVHSERKSLRGAICRCMGTPMARTPGRSEMCSSASSGLDMATMSYLSTRYGSIGAQKDSSELPMVVARTILSFEPFGALELFIKARCIWSDVAALREGDDSENSEGSANLESTESAAFDAKLALLSGIYKKDREAV